VMIIAPSLNLVHHQGVELHMLDVGQGDAVLLRTDAGRWILFDAGPAWNGSDAGRRVVLPYILRRGGALESFVLSHPHSDHVGGAASVLSALRPHYYWDAAFAGGAEAYIASLSAAKNNGIEWHRVHPGDSVIVDGVTLSFLAPDSAWTVGLKDPNLASTIALVRYGLVRFLLVGDAERAEEDWLLARDADGLRADVLKVGHHGSSTSSSDEFLTAVHPSLALISVGAGNMYGHPSADVVRALGRVGAEVLRTDESGTVVVRTDGVHIEVEAKGQKWELARGSSRR
jgi:competence protein ComEC